MSNKLDVIIARLKNHPFLLDFFCGQRHQALRRALFGGAIIGILFGIYFPNYARLQKLNQANNELKGQIVSLRSEIANLKHGLKKVKKDDTIYESVARESLGVAKDSEIVIDINR